MVGIHWTPPFHYPPFKKKVSETKCWKAAILSKQYSRFACQLYGLNGGQPLNPCFPPPLWRGGEQIWVLKWLPAIYTEQYGGTTHSVLNGWQLDFSMAECAQIKLKINFFQAQLFWQFFVFSSAYAKCTFLITTEDSHDHGHGHIYVQKYIHTPFLFVMHTCWHKYMTGQWWGESQHGIVFKVA